jgi:CCR4-NOT transcription complex subunit 7/8
MSTNETSRGFDRTSASSNSEHKNSAGEKLSASGFFKTVDGRTIEIRDVWASNLDEEMQIISGLVDKYKFVAMDTEFPGVVARPMGDVADVQYQTLRCNVDMLKLIQLGISLTDENGNWVDGCTCWQFNFKFSLSDDIFAQDSIELLKCSGIDFDKFEKLGIDVQYFGELMMMSGLVLNDDIKWISFHSKYDFGYLLKTLTCTELPVDEQGFLDLLFTYFPCIYDVKYIMTLAEGMHGGLGALAEALQVERIGPMHQAGSDSLLTAQTFFSLITKQFGGVCDDSKFKGELYGVGTNHTKHKNKFGTNGANGTASAPYPTLQYSSAVHYPSSAGINITQSPAGTNFGYEEGY